MASPAVVAETVVPEPGLDTVTLALPSEPTVTDVLERVPGPAVRARETTAPGFAVIAMVPGCPGPPAAPTSDRNAGTAVWARAVAMSEATAALAAASLVGLTARSWPRITRIAICAVDACCCLAGVTPGGHLRLEDPRQGTVVGGRCRREGHVGLHRAGVDRDAVLHAVDGDRAAVQRQVERAGVARARLRPARQEVQEIRARCSVSRAGSRSTSASGSPRARTTPGARGAARRDQRATTSRGTSRGMPVVGPASAVHPPVDRNVGAECGSAVERRFDRRREDYASSGESSFALRRHFPASCAGSHGPPVRCPRAPRPPERLVRFGAFVA